MITLISFITASALAGVGDNDLASKIPSGTLLRVQERISIPATEGAVRLASQDKDVTCFFFRSREGAPLNFEEGQSLELIKSGATPTWVRFKVYKVDHVTLACSAGERPLQVRASLVACILTVPERLSDNG